MKLKLNKDSTGREGKREGEGREERERDRQTDGQKKENYKLTASHELKTQKSSTNTELGYSSVVKHSPGMCEALGVFCF